MLLQIMNISVAASSKDVHILFSTYNDGICLPAVPVLSLIRNMSLYEITPIAGYKPIQYPDGKYLLLVILVNTHDVMLAVYPQCNANNIPTMQC